MFELTHLRCFVVLAEELHFGRAAERLHITQSPLSRQIQVLERILGVELFNRASRRVTLTLAGETFLQEAKRIVRLSESAALAARRVWKGETGRISIGFTAVSGYVLLPGIVKRAAAELPGLELQLHELVSGDQFEALHTGLIDLALVRPPVDRVQFDSVPLLLEKLLVALPESDPRSTQASFVPKDFDGTDLVMYTQRGAGYFHHLLGSLFERAGASPHYVQHVTQIHSLLGLVGAGLAPGIVPEAAAGMNPRGVVFRPLICEPQTPVELHLAWRRESGNAALPAFRELCLKAVAQPH
ncbi:LysR family transcriptional regulator [Sphingomonas mollis]|uniref:LysR family transcriptional regulator n=1 Tax=Sphingomonas mollis TaxID=2795726 RepID=A0ABS0XK39_9SPHN|nr:LysR family transcriptional regulator [Sphingomonas sp. BT553]MBJ6120403.1 LysR family transcriptional regulator [Sphingomonas sp. BT553]